MLTLKTYNPKEHYKLLQGWWDQYNWPHLPEKALPSGFVAYYNDIPIAASFVYLSDAAFGFIGWPVADKDSDSKVRKQALDKLTEALIQRCKDNNKELIYCFSKSDYLIHNYKKHGFLVAETNVTTMAINLSNENIEYLKE